MPVNDSDQAPRESNATIPAVMIDELIRCGVRHFCVSPGSRSSPLALAIERDPRAQLWLHLDERSGAFFGLGMAKATGTPVVLVCTSGTAAANFFPAIVEAFFAQVPLIVLTADRPHELRDRGAAQTINQIGLYGSHVRWFFELEEPEITRDLVRHVRLVMDRAAATARGNPPGPVHVNCPFREPLESAAGSAAPGLEGRADDLPSVAVQSGSTSLALSDVNALANRLGQQARGLIVAGPSSDPGLPDAVCDLATRLGFPILADPLSGVRCGPHDRSNVIDAYDSFLRNGAFAAQAEPSLILRFGAAPTSKPTLQYLERHAGAPHIVVDPAATWNEPTGLATEIVQADAAALCKCVAEALPPPLVRSPWLCLWRSTNQTARLAIEEQAGRLEEMFEGRVFAELAGLLPQAATLFVGNSMPVRDLDTYFSSSAKHIRFLCNRGVNGIDGVVSTALGAVAGDPGHGPLVLVIGDISLYHDSNGLIAARRFGLDATIVLLNNDGGGIFSFLPQSALPDVFEPLFGTPHGLDFAPLAALHGAAYTRTDTWAAFRTAVRASIDGGGFNLVEVPTSRARNVDLHRQTWRAVDRAIANNPATAGG